MLALTKGSGFSAGGMIFVFEVHLKEGYAAERYAAAWVRASTLIQQAPGARGTRLHRKIGDPRVLLAIARLGGLNVVVSSQVRTRVTAHLIERPFQLHDLIEVDGHTGLVQRMTTRGTVLMSMDGNHIQIPNATIYKSTIQNYTANPNRASSVVVQVIHTGGVTTVKVDQKILITPGLTFLTLKVVALFPLIGTTQP